MVGGQQSTFSDAEKHDKALGYYLSETPTIDRTLKGKFTFRHVKEVRNKERKYVLEFPQCRRGCFPFCHCDLILCKERFAQDGHRIDVSELQLLFSLLLHQPNQQNECSKCMFLQTVHMLKLCISLWCNFTNL